MLRFVGRRLLFILVVYVLIVFSVHMGMHMVRSTEVSRQARHERVVSRLVENGRQSWRETETFLANVLRGDLGSVGTAGGAVPIVGILGETYRNSMGLLLVALMGATLVGLLVGMIAALVKAKVITFPLLMLTIAGISAPSFFIGLLLQMGEIRYLALTGHRMVLMAGFGWDVEHMLMPVLVLAARPLAYLTRATFVSLSRVMQEDYMRTAFSKGLPFQRAVLGHALRNMWVPLMTAVGVSARFALSTLPVVEFFFAWPGMGRYLLEAIDARQTPVVAALASTMGLTFLLVNLLLDVAYRIVDPRTRQVS